MHGKEINSNKTRKSASKIDKRKRYRENDVRARNKIRRILRASGPAQAIAWADRFGYRYLLKALRRSAPILCGQAEEKSTAFADIVKS